ncbi:DUF3466 family protein [Litorilituus lipolyticus]|uniref:DUF3466 family protein n=1 Tax=Litorilituus lipolyticus TaxID=2491017 RepID=A0A502KQA0_9GAMM|nr:DUF3466 family protein [Litorilituus lipolyticus]TPH13900.1 DUF3466 family protein [Litorilituus lipolyticus]
MKHFGKNFIALGIVSAFSAGLITTAQAATYRVVDKNVVDELKYTYAQHQNNNGVLAISGAKLYNLPVQFDYLDELNFQDIERYAETFHEQYHELEDLEDYDAMVAGNPTANDLSWIIKWLDDDTYGAGRRHNRKLDEYQKFADTVAMVNLGGNSVTEQFTIFDVPFEGTEQLTRSTFDIISGTTDSGVAYGSGSAPYLPMEPFTDSNGNIRNYWIRDFGQRGFFSFDNGAQIVPVEPIETQYGGGLSTVIDINDNNTAVGYVSFKLNEYLVRNTIEGTGDGDCRSSGILNLMPFEVCVQRFQADMYHKMAYKASVSPDGEIITEQLGLLIEPHPDDERTHSSYATAVNNHGVAVGFADGWYDENVTEPASNQRTYTAYAVMYKDGEVFDFNQKNNVYPYSGAVSKAYDINDNGIAVGYIYNERGTKKFFYVDTAKPKDTIEIITPDDFFTTSDSTAYAVNENGFIVGDGQVETHNDSPSNPRRTAAFLYDINNDVFSNVNDLVGCDSPYTILEARDINDENVISATAIISSDRYDSKGELVLDDEGNPVKEDVVRAVVLEPIEGEIEDCSVVEEKVKRQGASIGITALWAIFALTLFRRRTLNKK